MLWLPLTHQRLPYYFPRPRRDVLWMHSEVSCLQSQQSIYPLPKVPSRPQLLWPWGFADHVWCFGFFAYGMFRELPPAACPLHEALCRDHAAPRDQGASAPWFPSTPRAKKKKKPFFG